MIAPSISMTEARLASHLQDELGRNLLTIKERQLRHPMPLLGGTTNQATVQEVPGSDAESFETRKLSFNVQCRCFGRCKGWCLLQFCCMLPVSRKILKAKKISRARQVERLRARLHFQTASICIVCFIVCFIACLMLCSAFF